MTKRVLGIIFGLVLSCTTVYGAEYEPTQYIDEVDSESEKYGNLDILTQLVHAEAGNQDLLGKRLVVDTVLNRVESPLFPDTIEEVIFQPGQFTCVCNGSFNRAAWHITSEDYIAVRMELDEKHNDNVLYFSRGKSSFAKTNTFKWGDHWFGY